jgi:hypothetical protein
MLVRDARAVARRWVLEVGRRTPGFFGAYVGGSASWLPADAPLPPTSDLDVYLVLEDAQGAEGAPKPGKFLYHGVLLEVSYVPRDSLRSPEAVLSHYHLAGGFRTPGVLLDPTGALTALQEAVGREFARRSWVRRRCEHAAGVVREWAGGLDETAPLHDQVTRTAFAAGVTTHVLLVAGLQNPTVRRRYAASRELLLAYGRPDVQEALLTLLGCAGMSPPRVAHHLSAAAAAFDAAKTRIRTPYRFAADISDAARPVAIDGSQELIDRGLHREAVFWIVATFSRCRHIFAADAPELLARTADAYHALLADLDLDSYPARRRRGAAILAYLPTLDEVTETILAANSAIQDDPPPSAPPPPAASAAPPDAR